MLRINPQITARIALAAMRPLCTTGSGRTLRPSAASKRRASAATAFLPPFASQERHHTCDRARDRSALTFVALALGFCENGGGGCSDGNNAPLSSISSAYTSPRLLKEGDEGFNGTTCRGHLFIVVSEVSGLIISK